MLKNKKNMIKALSSILIVSALISGCGSENAHAETNVQNTQTSTVQTQNSQIESYFTRKDGNLDKVLIKEINSAQKEIDIAIYTITKTDIATAIVDAKKRNVDVKLIADKESSQTKYEKTVLDLIKKNNIPVKVNSHEGLMHLKLTVIDGKTVLGGSYNYTKQATETNDENLLVIRDTNIVTGYVSEFNTMWNDTANYTNYQ